MEDKQVKLIPREVREACFPIASFLTQEQQEACEEVSKKYSGKARDSLNVPREGSNLWKILLLNQEGVVTTATLPQLDEVVQNDFEFLENYYEDGREVILRSAEDPHIPNDYLAKSLANQLKIKQFQNPLVIKGLRIEQDNDSDYGLVLKTSDETEVIEAPDFNHKNDRRRFSRINSDYSIEFERNGTRTLYTRDSGLSRLYLGGDLGLYLDDRVLSGSYAYGRVVVISAEVARENFGQYISQLQTEKKRQIKEIQARAAKAEHYLKTGKLE